MWVSRRRGRGSLLWLWWCSVADQTKVFVNGNWVGIVPDAEHIAQVIRGKRRENLIEFEVSVYRDIPNQEVRHVAT